MQGWVKRNCHCMPLLSFVKLCTLLIYVVSHYMCFVCLIVMIIAVSFIVISSVIVIVMTCYD